MAVLLACTLPGRAETLALEPGKPVELTCSSKSMVVAEQKFSATQGSFKVRLELGGDPDPAMGRWRVVEADAAHKSSFAAVHREACSEGCPMTAKPGARAELWAPRRAGLDQVPQDLQITVAALDRDKLTLRASTFRAKEIYALEEGECRVAG